MSYIKTILFSITACIALSTYAQQTQKLISIPGHTKPESGCFAKTLQVRSNKGMLNELAGNSNTNHQSIIRFKGKDYFIYHNGGINT